MTKINKKSLKWFIFSLVGIILTWGLVVPAFEFPDEQAHLGTVSYLVREGHLPTYHVPDMTIEMTQVQTLLGTLRDGHGNNKYTYHPDYHVEYTDSVEGKYEGQIASLNNISDRSTYTSVEEAARYPILYYLYSSIFWRLQESGTLIDRIFATRLNSLFIAALIALCTYKIGIIIFGKHKLGITLASISLLQPMFSFVTAGTNSDNLHNLLFTYATYLGLVVIKYGISPKHITLMGLTLLADLYTKPQGFIMIPILVLALFIRIIKEKKYRLVGYIFILIIATGALGWGQIAKYSGFLNIINTRGASFVDYLHFASNKLLAQNVVWYWGVFKWLGVVLPPIYWRLANRVVLISVIGLFVYFVKVIKNKKVISNPLLTLYLILVAIIYALVIFWFDWQYMKGWGFSLGIQARYFFPTLITHMSLLMIGLLSLGWSARTRILIRQAIYLLFLWLQLGAFWHLLSIYYDVSSHQALFIQLSQYKPFYAKGNIWFLWFGIYALSLTCLTYFNLHKRTKLKT